MTDEGSIFQLTRVLDRRGENSLGAVIMAVEVISSLYHKRATAHVINLRNLLDYLAELVSLVRVHVYLVLSRV